MAGDIIELDDDGAAEATRVRGKVFFSSEPELMKQPAALLDREDAVSISAKDVNTFCQTFYMHTYFRIAAAYLQERRQLRVTCATCTTFRQQHLPFEPTRRSTHLGSPAHKRATASHSKFMPHVANSQASPSSDSLSSSPATSPASSTADSNTASPVGSPAIVPVNGRDGSLPPHPHIGQLFPVEGTAGETVTLVSTHSLDLPDDCQVFFYPKEAVQLPRRGNNASVIFVSAPSLESELATQLDDVIVFVLVFHQHRAIPISGDLEKGGHLKFVYKARSQHLQQAPTEVLRQLEGFLSDVDIAAFAELFPDQLSVLPLSVDVPCSPFPIAWRTLVLRNTAHLYALLGPAQCRPDVLHSLSALDLNQPDDYGVTPLSYAAARGDATAVRHLTDALQRAGVPRSEWLVRDGTGRHAADWAMERSMHFTDEAARDIFGLLGVLSATPQTHKAYVFLAQCLLTTV